MKALNFAVFLGLGAAGIALFAGYTELAPASSISKLFAVGTTLGWLFSVGSVGLYIVGALVHLLGKMPAFWKRLFPVNLGVTVLGITFLSFQPELWTFWLLGVLAGAALAVTCRRLALVPWRPLVVVALLPLLPLQLVSGAGAITVIQVTLGAFLILTYAVVVIIPPGLGGASRAASPTTTTQ